MQSLTVSDPSIRKLVPSQVGYHKPTSVWFHSSVVLEKPSGQRNTVSRHAASNIPKSPKTKNTSNASQGSSESDLIAHGTTSLTDPRSKSSSGLKRYASSPSLRASPVSTSVGAPSISPGCSDVGLCSVDYEQYGEHSLNQECRLTDSQSKNTRTSRTFIAPGIDLTFQELVEAQNIMLYDQETRAVRFGDLFRDQKTVVIFIRHFLCPFCADYMRAIVRDVKPSVLAKSNIELIVVSHGSPHMIESYRGLFKLPYPVYTDPSRKIYRALNMTLRTLNGGPKSERGDYLEHNLMLGLARVAKNAITSRMPLYRYPGDFFQVGGEFVLGPGLQCSYVSRMFNTASHAPIKEVVKAAGVDLDAPLDFDWEQKRKEELGRIRQRKGLRRGQHIPSPHDTLQGDYTAMAETIKSVDTIRGLLDISRELYP